MTSSINGLRRVYAKLAFNNKAFKLYTVDKVIQSLVKHAHTILGDVKTSEIMVLFEKDRLCSSTSAKEQILYRLQTRAHMTNTENMFRIEFNEEKNHVCIQYIALEDLTIKQPKSMEKNWEYYVTSYSLPHPTEGVPQDELKIPFLEKTLELEVDEEGDNKSSPEGVSSSKLKIKIDPKSYALEIEPGSFDLFSRKSMNVYPTYSDETKKRKSIDQMTKFLDGKNGWKKNLTTADSTNIEDLVKKSRELSKATGEQI